MIKTIIFDLGGVIITLDQEQAVRRFEELGLKDARQWLDPYTQKGIFGELESGQVTAEEFRRELSAIIGRELSFDECRYGWLGYCKEVPRRNLLALRRLRDMGYRMVLLSNTNPYMMSWVDSPEFDGEGHSLADYLDAMYCSYKVGCMKPDRRFFGHVLQTEQVLPENCLFVDDGPRNVAAASQMGFYTICPTNGEDWTDNLFQQLQLL